MTDEFNDTPFGRLQEAARKLIEEAARDEVGNPKSTHYGQDVVSVCQAIAADKKWLNRIMTTALESVALESARADIINSTVAQGMESFASRYVLHPETKGAASKSKRKPKETKTVLQELIDRTVAEGVADFTARIASGEEPKSR